MLQVVESAAPLETGKAGTSASSTATAPPRQSLDAIFEPRTVAVIGATETPGSVGRTVLWNLISNPFGGTVFPVNPKRPNVMGIKAYPSIKDVPARAVVGGVPAKILKFTDGRFKSD